ncbi:MAG: molybdenum cofactor synthesis domain [Candidatus Bathyarchaeota archaeon B23]|nr:MAG: molybdenum cofactor synthesis domain [Candidatus Bathyarchaeota archaeon B23]
MEEHRRDQEVEAGFALLITSDVRTPKTDETGKTARSLLEGAGHRVVAYGIVPNDPEEIGESVRAYLEDEGVDAILISGGTGVSSRDKTIEAVNPLLERELPGFGELFRALSYREIGAAALLSRAKAGVAGGKPIFCLPGSVGAVRLALERLILPLIGHLLWEVRR